MTTLPPTPSPRHGVTAVQPLALLPFALFLAILPFPGTVALRLLCLVVAAIMALYFWWRQPENRPAIPCKPALILWLALAALSLAYSAIPGYSLGEFKNEIGYALLAFLSFLIIARNRETVEHLLAALAAGFALIGLWAAGAWVANGFIWAESGHYGGIAVFSTYIVSVAPALFCLAYAARRPWLRRAAWALSALAFLLALMTMQRAVWPALFAEVAVIALWRFRQGSSKRGGLIMAGLVVVAIAASFYATSSWRNEEPTGVEEYLSNDSRLAAWRGIVAKIAEHPWVGAGFGRGTMGRVYPELIPENKMISHPHNVFLNYGIAMGIPGMLAIAGLFFCLARTFWRLVGRSEEGLAIHGVCGLALVVGVVTRNQFNDLFIRDMALLYWALIGIFLGQATRLARNSP